MNWPTDERIRVLRESMLRLIPVCETASASFYGALFEAHPSLRPLFPEDMEAQQDKLVFMIASAIDMLDDPSMFEETCQRLGRRHVAFGAEPAHYAVVSSLAIEQLGSAAAPPFSDEERESWGELFELINAAMLRGAGGVEASANG